MLSKPQEVCFESGYRLYRRYHYLWLCPLLTQDSGDKQPGAPAEVYRREGLPEKTFCKFPLVTFLPPK